MTSSHVLALAALVAVASGCDAFGDDGPAWTQAGAVATFDYAPGPDSLFVLGPGREPPFRRAPTTERAVEMRIVDADRTAYTDRQVRWTDPGHPSSRFTYEARLPLSGDDIDVGPDGLRVTVAHDCPYIGLRRTGGSSGPLTFVRVPRTLGPLDVWTDCSRSSLAYEAVRTETITVPAGTFEAVVVEGPGVVEWWSWEAGLVRLDVVRYDGVLQGRFVRSTGVHGP